MSTRQQLVAQLNCRPFRVGEGTEGTLFRDGSPVRQGWYVLCGGTLYTRYWFATKEEAQAAVGDVAREVNRTFVQQRIARYAVQPHARCDIACIEPVPDEEKCC